MTKMFRIALVFGLFFSLFCSANWNLEDVEYLILKKVIRNMQWPNAHESGEFKIGIFGSKDAYNKANHLVIRPQHVNGKDVSFYFFEDLDKLITCQLVYVPINHHNQLQQIQKKYRDLPTLIVAESHNPHNLYADIILIPQESGAFSYKLNEANIDRKGLVYSSSLSEESKRF